ncbi:cobalt ABC transporter ATP-binding protein [Peptoniphilus lacrimalis]|uniref:energy-coupling factor ABC transporter ATP-binding protein n=1 Tax=Gardnerella TaxID=2701 RepID=UPI000C9CA767|nr:ABC transporter ATP-binding protein [Gardnerella vaginalis]MCT7826545.1 energy-coupling factor ABC transporter ATP-binding protein [Lactobacillus iners]PMC45155.1 cobalt ABC transporter ATP-binding protein [Peptoniphilus lacrimalis]RDW96477.1 cobalt ABC transporter ATP-binding protein [Gardnerella vaginalis]RDW98687.1 cobalt ABC transporter ATP-binding protein [Gardnerella vaginalis]
MTPTIEIQDTSPTIEIQNVSFSHTPTSQIFDDLNLSFTPGACAIVGQNGTGKTTLLKILRGLLTPKSGSVLLNGKDIAKCSVPSLAKDIGFVFQNPDDQIFESTVIREVMFGLLKIGIDKDKALIQAKESLKLVGLLDKSEVNPYDLSLCERKMVSIASILAMDTQVVILDEPTIAQDDCGKNRIESIIKRLVLQGKTVIAVLHDMNFVARVFNRVVVLSNGKVLFDGTTRDAFMQDNILSSAQLDKPDVVKLCEKLGYKNAFLSVEEFVNDYYEQ